MKKIIYLSLVFLSFSSSFSQTVMKEITVGHPFTVALPNYMIRATGLNDVASLQYKNVIKDIYGIVIEDNKEELVLAEMNYSSIEEFTGEFAKSFLKDQTSKKLSKPVFTKKGEIRFAEFDASFFDAESEIEIYYLVGVVETKTAFYKVLSWCAVLEKDSYKEDFRKILYSLRD